MKVLRMVIISCEFEASAQKNRSILLQNTKTPHDFYHEEYVQFFSQTRKVISFRLIRLYH